MYLYRVSAVDVSESPVASAQEVRYRRSSSGVTHYIVMKNDGDPYHQMSFSPERWTKVELQKHVVIGEIYNLP